MGEPTGTESSATVPNAQRMFGGRLDRAVASIIALCATGSIVLIALVAVFVYSTRAVALKGELEAQQAQASALADLSEKVLFDADLQLVALEDRLRKGGATTAESFLQVATSREVHDWMRDTASRSTALEGVLLVDAKGMRVASSRVFPAPVTDNSDRPYYKALRDFADVTWTVTAPLKNRQTSIDSLFFARKMVGADGTFIGVLAANIPAPLFERQFGRTELSGITSALARRNGEVLLQGRGSLDVAVVLGKGTGERLRDALAGSDRGSWTMQASATGDVMPRALGGGNTLVAVSALRTYPLVVLAVQPEAVALAEWRQQATWVVSMGALALGLLLILAVVMTRQVRLQQTAREAEATRAHNAQLRDQVLERRRAEHEVRLLNEQLEARIAQRTELLKAALEQAQQASSAKTDFLSHMSHELRTPLNAVLGFAQLLETDQQPALSARQVSNVQQILKAGEHLLNLISEVLDMARVEAGRMSTQAQAVDLAALVQDCVDVVSAQARSQGLDISVNLMTGVTVQTDPLRSRQVLLNLLSNAIKYNRPQGSVRVSLEAVGGAVRAVVADTGSGLSAQQLERLFVPFERLGHEGGRLEGAGLGLALSQRLMRLMGGDLGVSSVVGVGSRFWAQWPLASENAPGPAATVAPGVDP